MSFKHNQEETVNKRMRLVKKCIAISGGGAGCSLEERHSLVVALLMLQDGKVPKDD